VGGIEPPNSSLGMPVVPDTVAQTFLG